MKRLNLEAETQEEAVHYLEARSLQMLRFGVELKSIQIRKEVVVAVMSLDDTDYQALYIPKPAQGKGAFLREFPVLGLPILTSAECHIESFLDRKNIPYKSLVIEDSQEYRMIQREYGDQKARRSNVFLMNHIDEGRAILEWRGSSPVTHQAFCIHPLLQSDADLKKYALGDWSGVNPHALILAMEYRFIANDYLSTRQISALDDVKRSVLNEVMEMLVADKIQNRKDFEKYHKGTHPRSAELENYFSNWMKVLNISEDQYQAYADRLTLNYEKS